MSFKCLNLFGRKQEANPADNEMSIELTMPACYHGRTVPTSIVLMELLWQQYGLDMLHPELNGWLERYAPDVKYAAARYEVGFVDPNTQFKVGPKGTIELNLSLDVDDRLREVSSEYIFSQIKPSFSPHTEPLIAA